MADMETNEPKYLDESLIDEPVKLEHPEPEVEKKATDEKAAAEATVEEKKPEEAKPDPKVVDLEARLAEASSKIEELSKKVAPEPKAEARVKSLEEQYDEEFALAPADATKNLIKRQRFQDYLEQDLNHTKNVMIEAVGGRVPGWEDFGELAPVVEKLAEAHKDFVRPEFGGNIRVVELLAWAARGQLAFAKAQAAKKEAEAKAADEAKKVQQETQKQQVFMESNSTGAANSGTALSLEEFSRLPLSEMEKVYPYVES